MQQPFTHTLRMKYLPAPTARPRRTLLLILASLAATLGIFSLHAATEPAQNDKLVVVPHKLIADNGTYIRDSKDQRNNVWTDDPAKARDLLQAFGIDPTGKADLQQGEILAVFLNDHIAENFIQIVENKMAGSLFADYADSGIRFKMQNPGEGKKYTRLTAVIFKTTLKPVTLGIRAMIMDGISEKK